MLSYDELNFSQKRFIIFAINEDPSLLTAPVITAKRLKEIYKNIKDKHPKSSDNKMPYPGYPNWLYDTNLVDKGTFCLPVPDKMVYINELEKPKKVKVVVQKHVVEKQQTIREIYSVEEYRKELELFGIV